MLPAPDSLGIHPVIEIFARDLFLFTPRQLWPADFGREQGAWEAISNELCDWFRDRARAFCAGDMRVAPWRLDQSTIPA